MPTDKLRHDSGQRVGGPDRPGLPGYRLRRDDLWRGRNQEGGASCWLVSRWIWHEPDLGETHSGGARSEDVCCRVGFLHALTLALRLRAVALLWTRPRCEAFVVGLPCPGPSNSNGTVMSETNPSVALVRGAHCVLENPLCSRMFRFYASDAAIGWP